MRPSRSALPSRPLDRRAWLRLVGRSSAGLVLLGACGGGGGDDDPAALDAADPTDALVLPDGSVCRATTGDVLGPFYREGAPSRAMIAAATEPGERLQLGGTVLADDCATALAGVTIDVWQADSSGAYHEPTEAGGPYRLRGKLTTAADGTWGLQTIKPGNYENGPGGWRPAHLHFIVSAPGFRSVTTQIYFAGDPFLPPNDSCGTCASDDPARIVALAAAKVGLVGELPLVLQRV
jgi:protocatechuate 3,4-dioxygenase beta subunit